MVLQLPSKLIPRQSDVRETSNIGLSPNITDFSNSQHNHTNAAGGGTVAHSATTGKTADDHHTQNEDTALGSGAVAKDHGTASTDQIINVSYGTGSEPTASTTTEGSIYIKYTA